MARYSPGLAGHTLTSGFAPSPPFTLSAWVNLSDNGAVQHILGFSRTTSDLPFYALRVRFDLPAKNYEVAHRSNTSTQGVASASTSFPTGQWVHVAGVFDGAASRTAYVNGANVAADSTSIGATSIDQTTAMYSNRNSAPSQYAQGAMAHAAVWSAALTDNEISSLADGCPPSMIRPDNLVRYWPLYGLEATASRETDLVRRDSLVVAGTSWYPDPDWLAQDPGLPGLPLTQTQVWLGYRRPKWYPGLVQKVAT